LEDQPYFIFGGKMTEIAPEVNDYLIKLLDSGWSELASNDSPTPALAEIYEYFKRYCQDFGINY
jgi:hypothetical protein